MPIEAYRQGDVGLFEVKRLPETLKPPKEEDLFQFLGRKAVIVARGEATGHVHCLEGGTVYCDEHGNLFWDLSDKPGTIHHVDNSGRVAEHEPITVRPGKYQVRHQQEYQPEGWRRVND